MSVGIGVIIAPVAGSPVSAPRSASRMVSRSRTSPRITSTESFAGDLSGQPRALEELYRISAFVRASQCYEPLSKMTADKAAGPGYQDRPPSQIPARFHKSPFAKSVNALW